MDMKKIITSSAVAAVLAFGAAPADAQRNDRNGRNSNEGNGRDRGPSRQERVTPRDDRGRERAVPRENVPSRPQQEGRAGQEPRGRGEFRAPQRDDRRGFEFRGPGRDDRRGFDAGRFQGPGGRIAPRFERVVPYRFYAPRPYRPGLSLGFGIFFGRPFPYRYSYPVSPYGYSTVVPGIAYGGISFGISPGDADVYVDGNYVGVAEEFDGGTHPLTLAAGRHRIELQARGYAPMAFDADVLPGQVIPFQGAMQPGY